MAELIAMYMAGILGCLSGYLIVDFFDRLFQRKSRQTIIDMRRDRTRAFLGVDEWPNDLKTAVELHRRHVGRIND